VRERERAYSNTCNLNTQPNKAEKAIASTTFKSCISTLTILSETCCSLSAGRCGLNLETSLRAGPVLHKEQQQARNMLRTMCCKLMPCVAMRLHGLGLRVQDFPNQTLPGRQERHSILYPLAHGKQSYLERCRVVGGHGG